MAIGRPYNMQNPNLPAHRILHTVVPATICHQNQFLITWLTFTSSPVASRTRGLPKTNTSSALLLSSPRGPSTPVCSLSCSSPRLSWSFHEATWVTVRLRGGVSCSFSSTSSLALAEDRARKAVLRPLLSFFPCS